MADGPQDIRDAEGRLRSRCAITGAGIHGQLEAWDADGRPLARQTWVNGIQHGPAVTFGPDGGRTEMAFKHGVPHGPMSLYNADGGLSATATLDGGVLHGDMLLYEGGKPVRRLTFVKGEQVASEALTLAGKLKALVGR